MKNTYEDVHFLAEMQASVLNYFKKWTLLEVFFKYFVKFFKLSAIFKGKCSAITQNNYVITFNHYRLIKRYSYLNCI